MSTRESGPAALRGELVRSLTLIPAAAVVLSNVIGTGVFLKARVMTANVGTPAMVLTVYVVAGLLSLAGAMVYAELAAMMPRAGGEYNFLGAAYGRMWAFMFAWTRLLAASIAAGAISLAFATFLNDVTGGRLPPGARLPVALGAIVIATGLNLLPARSSAAVNTVLTAIKVALLALVGLGAFLLADGSFGYLTHSAADIPVADVPASARLGIAGFGAAMLGALWAYNGWNVISHIGGEVKDPGRNLPRALIGGVGLIIVLYLLVNTAYFYVLTPQEVVAVPPESSVAREAIGRFLGKGAAGLVAAGMMISAYGTLHTGLLTSPRMPFALARDGLLPGVLGNASHRGVPVWSVLLVGVLAASFALSGGFDVLTDMYIFVLWIFYGLAVSAVFVLRRKQPEAERPYRVWGYPVVPALFVLVALYLLANTLYATPGRAMLGLSLIAIGMPVYVYYRPRAAQVVGG